MSAADPLARFRFRFPIEVRFRDLDALGHVNNAVYLTYLESARIAWWMHVTSRQDLSALGMILARVELDYRSPVAYGESLEVGVRCASVRRSSLTVESVIAASGRRAPGVNPGAQPLGAPATSWLRPQTPEDGRVVAESRKVLVHYDCQEARSRPLPEELRQKLLAQDPDLAIEV